MLRSLSFVAVRQEHHESRSLFPLVFRRSDVLIDDGLRAVSKITKLRFPQNERVLRNDCVAVLESQHTFFRKRTVVNIETRVSVLFRAQLREWRPRLSGLRVVQNSMTLAERSAP